MPRFSIVVPAYNAAETLADTLDAVLAQTLEDWESIVVDDGSVDSTRRIAESYTAQDARIRTISQENQGSAGAYNTGVGAAIGDYVVLCSADDVLLPNHLEELAAFISSEPGYDIYSTNGYFWRPDHGMQQLVYARGVRDAVESLSLTDVIAVCFYSVGAAYRRELFSMVGGYRTDVFGEDYDFWLRAMALGARHRYLPRALSLHRVSSTQKSANLEKAYRSDIRLVTDLRDRFSLAAEELAAVERTVHERERLIGELQRNPGGRGWRSRIRRFAVCVIGEHRVQLAGRRLRLMRKASRG